MGVTPSGGTQPGSRQMSAEQAVAAYLSYQDAPLPPSDKAEALAYTATNDSAQKYGVALVALMGRYGTEKVEATAQQLRAEFDQEMNNLGLVSQPYSNSATWAMWDMAKQYHFVMNPSQRDARYDPRDPMTSPEMRTEIVNRHLGWELYANFQAGVIGMDSFAFHPPHVRSEIARLVEQQPNAVGTLASCDLAELGALARQAPAVFQV